MNVVTGATGLIGSHICLRLAERGVRVRAAFRNEKKIATVKRLFHFYKLQHLWSSIEWVYADVEDVEDLQKLITGADCVIHCAAVVSYHPKDVRALMETNVTGTMNVVNICLEENVSHLIHLSSISACGKNINTYTTENTPRDMALKYTNYSRSKYLSELEVWRGIEEGLASTIFNPGVVLGAGSFDQSSGTMFKRIARGLPALPAGGTGVVSVHDVANAVCLAIESGPKNDRYILVGLNIKMEHLFPLIAQKLRVKIGKKIAKKWQLRFVFLLEAIQELIFRKKASVTKEILQNYGETNIYNGEKATETFQFAYSPIEASIEEAIRFNNETSFCE
ncbi:MAG: SDR family NAD(P)-dependent oxidoreductase [Bacteroidota bacterium]